MLTRDQLHPYQEKAVNFQCTHPASALWLDMGLGKSVITLTSIGYLIDSEYLRAVIIVAPIRVCRLVWRQEAVKWAHTQHLTFSMVMGTKDQRTRALMKKADVYLINYENLEWLATTLRTYYIDKGRPIPFDGIVFDEVSKCKNSSTNRVRSLIDSRRKVNVMDFFIWRTGLTGTPASNGYKDLHGQYLLLDDGVRLGTAKTAFMTKWYKKADDSRKDIPYRDTEEGIKYLIGDITLEMSAEDYNPLPDMVVNDVNIELPENLRAMYDKMEKDFFIALDSGHEVEMFNQASLTNKCLAEGTEILTDSGWKYIQHFKSSDLLWDGEEWISAYGLVDNGYMPVIECWGVDMTPDHKIMSTEGWVEAKDVINEQSGTRHDRPNIRIPDGDLQGREQNNIRYFGEGCVENKMRVWQRDTHPRSEFEKQEPGVGKIMWLSTWGNNCHAWNDKNTRVDYLAKHAVEMYVTVRQGLEELRGAWNHCLQKMGKIRGVLGRYVWGVQTSHDVRTSRCEWKLRTLKLSMGDSEATVQQHTTECDYSNTYRSNNGRSSSEKIRSEANYYLSENRKRLARKRPDKTSRVYDILNAGPRHRFTVRGRNGEIFISHNCLQFSNGAMYPIAGMPLWEPIHDLKLDALDDIIEESAGQPILCSYAYRSDAERIMTRFKDLDPINLTECKSEKSLNDAMRRWRTGDCRLMVGHPASMGHGVDGLQDAGHTLVWFGLNWSLDLYEQFNARIRRQGQGVPVICHRILTLDTLDQAQALALNDKATTQNSLRNAIKSYRNLKESS